VKGRGRHERLDDGGVAEYFMTGRSIPDRWTISNIALTLAIVGGLVLCYFLAIPFLPAIVWSVTLGVLFSPLDTRGTKVGGFAKHAERPAVAEDVADGGTKGRRISPPKKVS
jgi:hypothetical protein